MISCEAILKCARRPSTAPFPPGGNIRKVSFFFSVWAEHCSENQRPKHCPPCPNMILEGEKLMGSKWYICLRSSHVMWHSGLAMATAGAPGPADEVLMLSRETGGPSQEWYGNRTVGPLGSETYGKVILSSEFPSTAMNWRHWPKDHACLNRQQQRKQTNKQTDNKLTQVHTPPTVTHKHTSYHPIIPRNIVWNDSITWYWLYSTSHCCISEAVYQKDKDRMRSYLVRELLLTRSVNNSWASQTSAEVRKAELRLVMVTGSFTNQQRWNQPSFQSFGYQFIIIV